MPSGELLAELAAFLFCCVVLEYRTTAGLDEQAGEGVKTERACLKSLGLCFPELSFQAACPSGLQSELPRLARDEMKSESD